MNNGILAAALLASAIMGGIVGGGIQANRDTAAAQRIKSFEDFDYDRCNWLVHDLHTGPQPTTFKEIKRTPGGNWCITTEE